MRKYTVIISETASYNLYNVLNYCKYKYSLSYALKIYSLIMQNIYSLSIFPNSNSLHSVTNTTFFRKRIVQKRYLIIFKVLSSTVIVSEIYDGRRNISPSNFCI